MHPRFYFHYFSLSILNLLIKDMLDSMSYMYQQLQLSLRELYN